MTNTHNQKANVTDYLIGKIMHQTFQSLINLCVPAKILLSMLTITRFLLIMSWVCQEKHERNQCTQAQTISVLKHFNMHS